LQYKSALSFSFALGELCEILNVFAILGSSDFTEYSDEPEADPSVVQIGPNQLPYKMRAVQILE
jgi:hypothetical protein